MCILTEIDDFYKTFGGEKSVIGRSVQGRPIYCFSVRKTAYPVMIFTYSIHAREYITAYLALKHVSDFYKYGRFATVHFIPLVNPDGVNICLTKNPLYKANARGVDLNVNFDANWGSGKSNVFTAGWQNYVGEHPFSEPESKALRDFTLSISPDITVSYHSKGQEIYWEFFQDEKTLKKHFVYAKTVSDATGYPLVTVTDSAGGYKDWCIQKLNIPALTIEVGNDQLKHPIGKKFLPQIYKQNKSVVLALSEKFNEQRVYEKGD